MERGREPRLDFQSVVRPAAARTCRCCASRRCSAAGEERAGRDAPAAGGRSCADARRAFTFAAAGWPHGGGSGGREEGARGGGGGEGAVWGARSRQRAGRWLGG